ncbi:NAD(P) transhydrogenase subunit beta [Acidithrix ferrooxidans]|uniref:NAD(P) transhydrogenase subunit beta n=2 Tax=Acidithrix ferrooxidans TaxID=1280514 RepID=A0A0D8HDQ1_9ACTN|nr:NAD(P) transhydrogenase subunit beta [Acidithrix ferrooxidans]
MSDMNLLGSVDLISSNTLALIYLISASLFILGLKGLSSPKSARRGNFIAAFGMILAIAASLTKIHPNGNQITLIVIGVIIGSVIGGFSARKVKMTAMPQMVAAFNGVGGGAAATVAVIEYLRLSVANRSVVITALSSILSVAIGGISFSGSIIAFAKLQEILTGVPITYKGERFINAAVFLAIVVIGIYLIAFGTGLAILGVLLLLAIILGVAFVLPIGGADMPVVISLLNAFTGLAVAASGFVLGNTVLIVGGTLVGASGTLLTKMMSDSMGRSIRNVLFASVGKVIDQPSGASNSTTGGTSSVRTGNAEDIGVLLAYSKKVIVVPGYGLAVAQAQHTVRDLARALEAKGAEVTYAIHPVAGRMPGHMNVLLAEADVPYEQLREMDEINDEFKDADVVLVVGANDVVNPAARNEPSSPIYGMPILNADAAKNVVFLKRSMRPGFAGVDNPLLYAPNTIMLFGDAKDSLLALLASVKAS